MGWSRGGETGGWEAVTQASKDGSPGASDSKVVESTGLGGELGLGVTPGSSPGLVSGIG